MPGSGKSTIGRQLARHFNLSFHDSDAYIEKVEGRSIRVLFEEVGERRFREIESEAIESLTNLKSCVISTGGGSILLPANRDILKTRCRCIYLRSRPEELIRRLRSDKKRPLLQVADPLAVLRRLFAERDPLYQATATFVVDTGRPSVQAVVNTIIGHLNSLPDTPQAIDYGERPEAS